MLTQFVAMSSNTAQVSQNAAALQVMTATPSSSGIINLTLPASNGVSSSSMSALLLS
jgi:hypothetical protein